MEVSYHLKFGSYKCSQLVFIFCFFSGTLALTHEKLTFIFIFFSMFLCIQDDLAYTNYSQHFSGREELFFTFILSIV